MSVLTALLFLLLFVVLLSACIGALPISMNELWAIVKYQVGMGEMSGFSSQQRAVLMNIRLPRIILGVLIGAALATSGAVIQGLFRNPLSDPGLIGISSGASFFAVLMIVLEASFFKAITGIFGYYALSVAAFVGACLTTWIVYRLAMKDGKADVTLLLLVGISINALTGSFTGLLTYVATDEQLRNITFWSLGSLGGASWQTVIGVLPFTVLPVCLLPLLAKPLNALILGEAQAALMGIKVYRVKQLIVILATIAVGGSVAVAGMIGFIGLVTPHIIRIAFGADNHLVLPASALLGAAILSTADLIARTLAAPQELPIGILTALLGTPVFLYIILADRRKMRL
jgi:iron complex transport system permease protein